jgi:hypothetical protein
MSHKGTNPIHSTIHWFSRPVRFAAIGHDPKPVPSSQSISVRPTLMSSAHLIFGLKCDHFRKGFLTKLLHAGLDFLTRTVPSSWFHYPNKITACQTFRKNRKSYGLLFSVVPPVQSHIYLFWYLTLSCDVLSLIHNFWNVTPCIYIYIHTHIHIYVCVWFISRRCQYLDYITLSGMRIREWWIWEDLEGSGRGIIEVLTRHLPGGEEKELRTSVRTAGVPADIRTEHLPNTSLGLYRYTNVLGEAVWSGR